MLTFTPAETAEPDALAAYQARLAKLAPACSRCGRKLGKRETAAGRCAARDDCRLRQIFAGPRFPSGKPLALAEVHALAKNRASRAPIAAPREPVAPTPEPEPIAAPEPAPIVAASATMIGAYARMFAPPEPIARRRWPII